VGGQLSLKNQSWKKEKKATIQRKLSMIFSMKLCIEASQGCENCKKGIIFHISHISSWLE